MSYGFSTCVCPPIQQALNNIVGTNATSLRRDRVGMIEYLRSPENLSGAEIIQIDPGNGKRKTVTVNYYQKMCESSVNESITDDCSTGTETVPYCEDVTITNELETTNQVFDQDNMRRICEPLGATDEAWIARIMMAQMNALLTSLDKLVITQVMAAFGTFMDGSTIKPVQLFNTVATDAQGPRALALSLIQDEFDQAGFNGVPSLIGANKLNRFYSALDIGAVNAAGLDLSKLGGATNFFYDRFVEPILGVDEFIVMALSVAQLLTWNKYRGNYAVSSPTFEHGTVVDPFTGIMFDLKMHYNDCTDMFYIKLQLNWEFWSTPDDQDASCIDQYGVNGIYNYEVCDTVNECASGHSVS